MAAPAIVPAAALGLNNTTAAGERITVGVIGLGSRGFNLLDSFLAQPDVQVVAICDVDEVHYRDNPWGKGRLMGRRGAEKTVSQTYAQKKSGSAGSGLFVTGDFRDVCSRSDVDAIVIATPDHWHALCTLQALRSGKDVYCEKPITHTFHEGQTVYREVAKQKAVFQTGSQQRSTAEFHKAVELVLNGHIGRITSVEVGLPPGYDKPMGDTSVSRIPAHLDYDFWCGPAEKLPYMRARHHRWWRGHRAFGGGVLMDWIGHHNDIAHWGLGMDKSGPTSIEAVDWTFPDTDVYNTPLQYEIRCEYSGGITTTISTRHRSGTKFVGEDGWIHVDRGKLAASSDAWLQSGFDVGHIRAYDSHDHTRNFLDCVLSRQECIAPAETAHRSVTPGHLGYISNQLGRKLSWNAATESLNDDRANELLHEEIMRTPWSLTG
jgi:predicted dehydrogenase